MQTNKENQSRVSRVSKQSMPEPCDDNLEEYMDILHSHQKQCEKQGKYLEADAAKKQLAKVRTEVEKQKKQRIIARHQNERREVEMAHVEEITQFNKYWDEKMIQFQEEAERIQEETVERHQAEMEEFHKEIEESIYFRQKDSSEAINLKKMEENLAKEENYIEAHKIQKQLQQIQKMQFEKWMITRNKKIQNLLNQLRNKQEGEASALRQRIQQGFQEQKKIREEGYETLVQKYTNFMKGLQNHHSKELTGFEKTIKLQSTASFSKAASMSRALQSIQNRN